MVRVLLALNLNESHGLVKSLLGRREFMFEQTCPVIILLAINKPRASLELELEEEPD